MQTLPKLARALADGSVLVLGGLCLAAAVAAQGGRFSEQLDLLTHFAPYWCLAGLATAAYGAIFVAPKGRRALLAVGGAGVLAALLLILPELTRPIRPSVAAGSAPQIKIIQFNVWDRNVDVPTTADWIVSEKPDVVLMQEVNPEMLLAMHIRGFHYTRGIADVAIFSRVAPKPQTLRIAEADWHRLPTFARASFTIGGEDVTVMAVHLGWPVDAGQKPSQAALGALVDRYDRSHMILAGDFNLTPWSFALRRLDRRLGLERRDRAIFSWPAERFVHGKLVTLAPILPIDHVYAGSAWRTVSLRRGPHLGSEHFPLIVTLALQD